MTFYTGLFSKYIHDNKLLTDTPDNIHKKNKSNSNEFLFLTHKTLREVTKSQTQSLSFSKHPSLDNKLTIDNDPNPEQINSMISKIQLALKSNRGICIGSNHTAHETYKLLENPKVISALKDAGVKRLFIEFGGEDNISYLQNKYKTINDLVLEMNKNNLEAFSIFKQYIIDKSPHCIQEGAEAEINFMLKLVGNGVKIEAIDIKDVHQIKNLKKFLDNRNLNFSKNIDHSLINTDPSEKFIFTVGSLHLADNNNLAGDQSVQGELKKLGIPTSSIDIQVSNNIPGNSNLTGTKSIDEAYTKTPESIVSISENKYHLLINENKIYSDIKNQFNDEIIGFFSSPEFSKIHNEPRTNIQIESYLKATEKMALSVTNNKFSNKKFIDSEQYGKIQSSLSDFELKKFENDACELARLNLIYKSVISGKQIPQFSNSIIDSYLEELSKKIGIQLNRIHGYSKLSKD